MLSQNGMEIQTEQFDGPLGLLLLLVQKQDIPIASIDLALITQQYLQTIENMLNLNFDVAGEYLLMASTLIHLKSQDTIRQGEFQFLDEDSSFEEQQSSLDLELQNKQDLVAKLESLQHFQFLGQKLWSREKLHQEVFKKPRIQRKSIADTVLTPLSLEEMTTVLIDYFWREKRKYTVVKRDRLSIKEKLDFLKTHLVDKTRYEFRELLEMHGGDHRDNVVMTFISLLELARLKVIEVFQNENYSLIYIHILESLKNLDLDQAKGFELELDFSKEQLSDELREVE